VRGIAQLIVSDIQPLQNISVTNYLRDEAHWASEQTAAWLRHWIGRGMAAVEQALDDPATGSFCHGDSPTLADLCLVPQCYASRRFGVDVAAYPRIAGIERRCLEMPEFRVAAPEAQPDAEVAAR
jgi:maleylacetoacetate isomerase